MPPLFLHLLTALSLWAALAATPHAEDAPAAPVPAESADALDAGAYLAGREAEIQGDFPQAMHWLAEARRADPENIDLLSRSILADIVMGNLSDAAELATTVKSVAVEKPSLIDFALLADAARREDYAALAQELKNGRSIGRLFDGLALGWAEAGEGRMSEALKQFDAVIKEPGLKEQGLFHKAMALAMVGDYEGADDILSGKAAGPVGVNSRGVIAHAEILSQLERGDEALALLDRAFGDSQNADLEILRAQLGTGKPAPFDAIRNPRDGIAEIFYTLATSIGIEADPTLALLHSRAALALRPDHIEALMISAALFEQMKQYGLAAEIYASVPADNPAYLSAEVGRAQALYADGQKDDAISALNDLAENHPGDMQIQAALADLLRGEERWKEALAAYDEAIALIEKDDDSRNWSLYFSRGITLERLGRYSDSVAAMRKALELQPDEPQVLNYLGYSMLEEGDSLDEAIGLIKRAVKAEPNSGYILDSLAWAYFRLGDYKEALAPMERAAMLEPVEPVVTDHLGDVYWMNGRKREARFQWRRALSFGPEEKDAQRIREKLAKGLDAVMQEEGDDPLPATKSAGNAD